MGALPGTHRTSHEHPPLENLGVNTSDLYNILDMGGVLQVLQLEGTRNEINRNYSTFYEIYTFYLEKMHNSCKCVNNLILSYSAHKEPLF